MNIQCGGGAGAARQAHNLEVGGASPSHATNSLGLVEGDSWRGSRSAPLHSLRRFSSLNSAGGVAVCGLPVFFKIHTHTDYP